jgi:8-oxo-dGTP pyrophosphatase MutT (NUDIX family)
MGYLDHIRRCTAWDPADCRPVVIGDRPVGLMRSAFAKALGDRHDLVKVTDAAVVLDPRYDDFKARTDALAEAAAHLRAREAMARPRGELFAVVERWGAAPLAEIDRTATHAFGFPTFGQHVNGWALDGGMMHLWIGRRATDRRVAPGKLDNIVAGGVPAGLTLAENLAKEAEEEAGFGPDLVARMRPVGAVSYRMAVPEGLRRDVLFCYDLEVPEGVEPVNTDGEVAAFERWPLARVAEALAAGDRFKFNVPLVILDFTIRHGALTPDDPDYMAILQGLHGPA